LVSRLLGPTNLADAVTLTLLQVWPAVAVAIAITRHGLYSIDRLFNRTLVYVALTVALLATYALVSLVAGLAIGDSELTASLATIAAALVFLPLRARVQTLVDRRFARKRFEAVRLLRDFLDEVRHGRAEPEDVGAVLQLALGDPEATLAFQLPETGAHADRNGRVVELPDDGRERSVIGRELGVLIHAPVAPDLLRGVLDAAAVPVELARLRVELRLQLAEVESSRARIAQAGYEERRRLERDLHDGAQQRLVTLGIVLRRLQRSLPREAQMLVPALDAAVDEVAASIADLSLDPPILAAPRGRGLRPWPIGRDPKGSPRGSPADRPWRPPTARRRRSRRPRTSSPARRSRTPSARVAFAGVGGDAPRARRAADDDRRRRDRGRRTRGRVRPAGHARPRRGAGRDARHPQPGGLGDADRRGAAMRIVIAEDTVLLREGLAGLLEDAGHDVAGKAGDADMLLTLVAEHELDLAVVDVRMPPGYDDEGTRAAATIRTTHPQTAVLVLSQHIETRHIVPYPEAVAGDTLDIYAVDYAGNHSKHAKRPTASEHVACRFTGARRSRIASRTWRSAARC